MSEVWADRLRLTGGFLILAALASIFATCAHYDGDVVKMVQAYQEWKNPPYVMPPTGADKLFWKELQPDRSAEERLKRLTALPSSLRAPMIFEFGELLKDDTGVEPALPDYLWRPSSPPLQMFHYGHPVRSIWVCDTLKPAYRFGALDDRHLYRWNPASECRDQPDLYRLYRKPNI